MFGSRPTLGPGHGRDLAKRTAPAIAVFHPPCAEALTSHLGPADRAETLLVMARRVSGADLEQARTWLGTAYRAALDDRGLLFAVRAARLLGEVVQAAAAIDQQLARRAAERLACMPDVQQLQPYTLTPEHPDRAPRIAESFTDDEVRNAALRQIVVAVAQPRRPRRVITDSVEDRPRSGCGQIACGCGTRVGRSSGPTVLRSTSVAETVFPSP